jgi:hypothetical protein
MCYINWIVYGCVKKHKIFSKRSPCVNGFMACSKWEERTTQKDSKLCESCWDSIKASISAEADRLIFQNWMEGNEQLPDPDCPDLQAWMQGEDFLIELFPELELSLGTLPASDLGAEPDIDDANDLHGMPGGGFFTQAQSSGPESAGELANVDSALKDSGVSMDKFVGFDDIVDLDSSDTVLDVEIPPQEQLDELELGEEVNAQTSTNEEFAMDLVVHDLIIDQILEESAGSSESDSDDEIDPNDEVSLVRTW